LQQAGEFDAALAMFRRCSSLNADIWAWLDEASHLHRRGDMVACLNVLEAASVRWPERVDIWRRLAKWYHVQGNWKKAEACLWTAVKISPRDVWSRCELAEVQLRLGQRDNALQSLEQARETWSQPARVLRLQSRLHRDALEHAEAEASLREALAIQPSDVQAWVDLADLLARQERFKEARGLCIPKNNEGRQAAALLRRDAWLLHEMGAPLKARSRMLEAVAAAPHVLECWLELSKLNRRLSDWAEAQRAAAYAVQYWPGEPEAWVVLGEACAGRNDLSGAHRAFGRALNLVPDVEWVGFRYVEALSPHDREALHTAESLVSRCPASIDVRLRAANLLADLGRGEEAINLLKDAAAAAPAEDERPLLQQAEILIDLKRTEAGMKTAAGVLARRLQSTRAMRALARGHKALGQLPQAEAQLRAALVRDPLDVNNWIELAWLAVDKNNPRTTPSQAVLEEALEQNPHSLRLRRDLLGLCVDVGDTARARALLDELLSLNPLDPQDLVRWSYSVFRLGLSEPDREAAHAVAAALDRQPESWAAWLRQSELLERTSDSKAALEAAMRALDSARAVPKPLTMLKVARQLMWTGDTKLASEVADQVLRDQPVRDPWMLSIAALIYQKAELWPQCIECLRSAVKLQPDDNDLQTRLQAALHASANPP
jgi:tetratricopeptide (TPR) repeat protein